MFVARLCLARTLQSQQRRALRKFITQEDRRDFLAVFPSVARELSEQEMPTPELAELCSKTLRYNLEGGGKLRGLTVVSSYRMLEKPEFFTPENVHLSQILGWCMEMFQAFFVILDDLMDESEVRRGRLAWHKVPGVGRRVVMDACLVESCVYALIKRHLSSHAQYVRIVELLQNTFMSTTLGQITDHESNCRGNEIDKINEDRYNMIVKHKTALYTSVAPVTLGMYLANLIDPECHRQAKSVLLEIGHYFQVQDDFLDAFGDQQLVGKKTGMDIQDGKCSWPAVVALQRASPAQKQLFKSCFGSKDPEKVERVKGLYRELSLPEVYAEYEEKAYEKICARIKRLNPNLPQDLFVGFLNEIYKRAK